MSDKRGERGERDERDSPAPAKDNERSPYEPSAELSADLARIRRRALPIAIVAIAACALGAFLNPTQFLRSYLIAFVYWLSIALGCSALLMLQHVARGGWGIVLRRTLEAAGKTIPAFALLFVPILIGLPRLYVWARPDAVAADPHLHHTAPYLNVPFFIGRTVFYFAVWSGFVYALSRMSRAQDNQAKGGDLLLSDRLRYTSGIGLAVYCLLTTFAGIDWLMSLNPHWYSTIYGVYLIGGQSVAALSFSIIAALLLSSREPLASAIRVRHFHDFGKLLFAFVMLWAYFALSQFLIIWSGNLPEEIPWYLDRMHGSFRGVSLALILLHFALPFLLLLSRDIKRNARRLAMVAALLLAMRWVDLYWLVTPAFEPKRATAHWLDIAAPIAIGAIWIWLFTGELGKRPLLPIGEPHLAEALSDG